MSTAIDRTELIALLACGASQAECAREIGCDESTIRRAMIREGIEIARTAAGVVVITARKPVHRLPDNIARLLPDGRDIAIEDLTLKQARAIIGAASDEIATARRLLASLAPTNWREDAEWVGAVDWLGGAEALSVLIASPQTDAAP